MKQHILKYVINHILCVRNVFRKFYFISSRLEEENHNFKEKHIKFSVQLQNEEINLPGSVAVSVLFVFLSIVYFISFHIRSFKNIC